METTKQSSLVNLPIKRELGFPLPQSNWEFDWRCDPFVPQYRQLVIQRIQEYLKQAASGRFLLQVTELAVDLENKLFTDALSKEDYMDSEKLYDCLRFKLHQKYFEAKSVCQESVPFPLVPLYAADQTCRRPSNFSANQNKSLPNLITTPNTGSRKRTFHVTSSLHEQVIPNNCYPGRGFSSGGSVDSGPTFSQSVLPYGSEASYESHRMNVEGELDPMIPSCDSSPSVAGENLKFEAFSVSDEAIVQKTVVEPSQFERQLPQPMLQFDEYYHGENENSGKISVQKDTSYESYVDSSRAIVLSCYEGSGQIKVRQGPAIELLCCYIAYNMNPLSRAGSKISYLECLHSTKCNGGLCSCERYKSLFSHFDKCGGAADCDVCRHAIRKYSAGLTWAGFRNLRNGNKRMMCVSNCSNTAYPDKSEVIVSSGQHRKLTSFSHRHGSSCGDSVLTGVSICLQKSIPRIVVNPYKPGTQMEMVESSVLNISSIGDAGNIGDNDVLGSNSDKACKFCEDLSADFKQETEYASLCEFKAKVTDGHCLLPSDCISSLYEEKRIAQENGVRDPGDSKPAIPEDDIQPTAELSEKQMEQGITLINFFTVEEIKLHISSLRQKVDQSASEVPGNTENFSVSENFCQICTLAKLTFPPVPMYCSACGMRIKNYGTYYSARDENHAQICFCSSCHNNIRGGYITDSGLCIPKIGLDMKKNSLTTEESWVQCGKCQGWQHQICALFNDQRNLEGKEEYVCPKCYLEDPKNNLRIPLPRSTAFDASNLPRTLLSDHIEKWLFRRLKQEKEDRAKADGKTAEEVPEPTNLVVRVVASIDKKLQVKQQFLDIFPENNYPAEFPYRSKVILLFQRIEGVDVCLFAMCVQEFGSECPPPNQRCTYISYLDSVKYFRPEIKTVGGEALRTFAYHEILVGYLDYCKKRGFATCYIWSCPPVRGEDYVLYGHPEIQKTPKPEKLRQWYQLMLKKASKENIVVNFTNLYEKFFVPTGECNAKVTAARLPYFDGDYWSTVAESMIKKIEQEDMQMKVKKMTRRSLKTMGHVNPSTDDVKDILLMQELGQSILSTKEDFIIVYLQFVCTHCHELILSGNRWFCRHCKNYQICQRCHDADLNSEPGDSHISSNGQKHALSQELVNDVPIDTKDKDAIMENCFLESRHDFLSFCQGNHYLFDSLRRAKHSSMMILYHLHNPNGSNTKTFCSLCLKDIKVDPRWKCKICLKFNACDRCYKRNKGCCHSHTLTYLTTSSCEKENQMLKMVGDLLNVVLHASHCPTTSGLCSYPNCALIKKLFSHTHACKIQIAGGCCHCKKTWFVLILHSRRCKDLNCGVPRCRDLKKSAEA